MNGTEPALLVVMIVLFYRIYSTSPAVIGKDVYTTKSLAPTAVTARFLCAVPFRSARRGTACDYILQDALRLSFHTIMS